VSVYVKGYTKKDGTYVAGYWRSSPNDTMLDNYSTKGNINPYTGKAGTIDPYASTDTKSVYSTISTNTGNISSSISSSTQSISNPTTATISSVNNTTSSASSAIKINTISGSSGIDSSYFSGQKKEYTIVNDSSGAIHVLGHNQDNILTNIERLKFDDVSIAFDINGAAGQMYRLYSAAFDRVPDSSGLGYWINAVDHGNSPKSVANSFIDSIEFKNLYGENTSNEAFVKLLYKNVLNRDPDQGGQAYWLNSLDSGITSKADLLFSFSESVENQNNTIALIGNGIEYVV